MHNPAPVLENNTHKLLWNFDIYTDHLISARRPDLVIINKNRIFAKLSSLPSHRKKKLKEWEKKDKNLDLPRELKKLWNVKVTIVPIVIGAFGTITKGLLKGLDNMEVGGRVETIEMTTLLRTVKILRRVLETCCHSNSSEIPSAVTDVRNSKGVNNNNSTWTWFSKRKLMRETEFLQITAENNAIM